MSSNVRVNNVDAIVFYVDDVHFFCEKYDNFGIDPNVGSFSLITNLSATFKKHKKQTALPSNINSNH